MESTLLQYITHTTNNPPELLQSGLYCMQGVHRGPQQRGWAEIQDRASSWGRSWGRGRCPRLCPERGAEEEEQPSRGRVLPLTPSQGKVLEQKAQGADRPQCWAQSVWSGSGACPGAFCIASCLEVKLLSRVRLFATPWTVARWVPPSMGIFQARILEWVAISFSRGSSQGLNLRLLYCTQMLYHLSHWVRVASLLDYS